jgi:hypothetical protein
MEKNTFKIDADSSYAMMYRHINELSMRVQEVQDNYAKEYPETPFSVELSKVQEKITEAGLWLTFFKDIHKRPELITKVKKVETNTEQR